MHHNTIFRPITPKQSIKFFRLNFSYIPWESDLTKVTWYILGFWRPIAMHHETIFCPITISGGPSFGLGSNLRLYKANDSYKICTVNRKWRLTSSSWAFSMRQAWRIEQARNDGKPWTFTKRKTLIPAHKASSPHHLPHPQLHPQRQSPNPPTTYKSTLTPTPTTPGEKWEFQLSASLSSLLPFTWLNVPKSGASKIKQWLPSLRG